MNRLESDMGGLARWIKRGNEQLTEAEVVTLRRWAITRHLLLAEMDGNTSAFDGEHESDEDYVVPLSSLARAVYEGNIDAINDAPIALARSTAPIDFAWAFGHPTVRPAEKPALGRFAATSVLTIGALQIWTTTPIVFDYEVAMPAGLVRAEPGRRPADLALRPGIPSASDVTVTFLDVERTSRLLNHLAQLSEAELIALSQQSPEH